LKYAIRAATALYGFSLAVALAPRLAFPARPGDPLSALKLAGYSSRGVVLQFVLAVLLTAIFAMIGDRVARLIAVHRWASIAYCSALLFAPITLMSFGNDRHLLLIGVVAAAIVALRKRDPHFTRGDVILIPIFLSCYIAFLDLDFGRTPVATCLRAALAVFALRLIIRDSAAFVLAPLALFFEIGLLQPKIGGALALIVLFGTPIVFIVMRTVLSGARRERPSPGLRPPSPRSRGARGNTRSSPSPRSRGEGARRADEGDVASAPLRRIIYPLIVFLYPLAVLRLPPPTEANFFEDGHNVTVATEMLRGERPYKDIIPTHGLFTDGLIDFGALKLGPHTMRTILGSRLVVGMLSSVAIYCLVVAATGSAEMGLLAAFLAFSLYPGATIWVRPWAALFALAATVAATRLRSRRWFVVAGALVVLAYLVSIDFGIYAGIVALFAAFRMRALRAFAIGFAAALVVSLLIFAIFGFAIDFIRVNVSEIIGGHGVYFIGPLQIPDCLRSPALIHHLAGCLDPLVWIIALIASCAAFASSPFRGRRYDAPWLIGIFIVVAAASYVERGNFHFYPAAVPFLIAALWVLSRHSRTAATILSVILILIAEPVRHVITVIPNLRKAPMPALFNDTVSTSIKAARRFAATLDPHDTFVDFSNSALIYPLLGRDCPLRQIEVANYQSNDAQREVIARLERNRHVRAALMAFPGSNNNVDGISNADRAPLVAEYLRRNFKPAFDQDGVVFWVRSTR
jgi:hypothetical protein